MDLFDENLDAEILVLPFKIPENSMIKCIWNDNLQGFNIYLPHGELFYSPTFLSKKISDRTIEYFLENDSVSGENFDWSNLDSRDFEKIHFKNIKWKQDTIKMYGKTIPLPRITSWYGDEGASYKYSGISSEPNAWNKGLLYIKEQIEKISTTRFNSVLLNWYRNGEDYLNWHKDDEPELGENPIIASVNFGESRDFQIRYIADHDKKLTIPLTHGSLLIMAGEMQHYWEHCIPKRKKVNQSRFNLTFRTVKKENNKL